jgi:hypothetical protein
MRHVAKARRDRSSRVSVRSVRMRCMEAHEPTKLLPAVLSLDVRASVGAEFLCSRVRASALDHPPPSMVTT